MNYAIAVNLDYRQVNNDLELTELALIKSSEVQMACECKRLLKITTIWFKVMKEIFFESSDQIENHKG